MEEYTERFSGPFEALAKQFAHASIRPAETRVRLIQALEILGEKREVRPEKNTGSCQFKSIGEDNQPPVTA